ncbi:transposase [Tistrella mobilis]|uniref:Transposase n=1 Tax=Tistrella mobilis TaxID=171437 RepID=A0A161R3R3_9PROT|nr:transposase [Tistrella mobilis]
MHEIVNAIFYVLRVRIIWRLLPKSFLPMPAFFGWLLRFRCKRVFEIINHHLVMRDRERGGREVSPSTAIMDSQSV